MTHSTCAIKGTTPLSNGKSMITTTARRQDHPALPHATSIADGMVFCATADEGAVIAALVAGGFVDQRPTPTRIEKQAASAIEKSGTVTAVGCGSGVGLFPFTADWMLRAREEGDRLVPTCTECRGPADTLTWTDGGGDQRGWWDMGLFYGDTTRGALGEYLQADGRCEGCRATP